MCSGGLQLSSAARFTELGSMVVINTFEILAIFPCLIYLYFLFFFIFAKLVNVKR
jgi:hypothetical protein